MRVGAPTSRVPEEKLGFLCEDFYTRVRLLWVRLISLGIVFLSVLLTFLRLGFPLVGFPALGLEFL